jgi:hypothetical protein
MSPVDHVTLLFCLMRDADARIKEAGSTAFAALPEDLLLSCATDPGVHPAILDAISRFHHGNTVVTSALLENVALSLEARNFLGRITVSNSVDEVDDVVTPGETADIASVANQEELPGEDPDDVLAEDDEEDTEIDPEKEDDEFLSKFQLIQLMGISEKIKMALTGDKEWRSILVNDNNKLVSSSVIRNPRITDGEILRILKVGVQNDDIIRLICENREWVKNPLIRKALVDCPKTPLPNALRYLATLGDKEIAAYAKSRNISSVISTQAKRIILSKKR